MAIPKYDEIQFEALKVLKDGKPRRSKEFIDPLAVVFSLTEEDLAKSTNLGMVWFLLIGSPGPCPI